MEMQNLQLLNSINGRGSRGQTSSPDRTSTAFTRAGSFQPNLPGHQRLTAARTLLQPLPVPRQSRSQSKASSTLPSTHYLPQSQADVWGARRCVPTRPGTLLNLQPHDQALDLRERD